MKLPIAVLQLIRLPRKDYFKRLKKSQTIVEIGTFGAILLMLLGVLLSFGLKTDNQLRVQQVAFRRALKDAEESTLDREPSSVNHMMVYDRHIPDPANAFGHGQVQPFSAAAGVTRSYLMYAPPENEAELPTMVVDMKGNTDGRTLQFKTAGFGIARRVHETIVEDFSEVFGGSNIAVWCKDAGDCRDNDYPLMDGYSACWVEPGSPIADNEGNEDLKIYSAIKVLDPCKGEVADFDACKKQCQEVSELGLDVHSDYDFGYCANFQDDSQKKDLLEKGSTQEITEASSLTVDVANGAISAVDRSTWNVETTRTINTNAGTQEITTEYIEDGAEKKGL